VIEEGEKKKKIKQANIQLTKKERKKERKKKW
jgi:hypothetical protein